YNEEQRLGPTLERVLSYLDQQPFPAEIVVVDDGSRDQTAVVAKRAVGRHTAVRVVRYANNRGKGYAVRVGMSEAHGQLMLLGDAYDVVIGSRALPESDLRVHQPWLRERLGRTFNLLVRILGVRGLSDTQCGFKLFTRRAAVDIFPRLFTDRWVFDVEALLVA